jgi:predicted RNA-binding protein YlxR (DUF448 family)
VTTATEPLRRCVGCGRRAAQRQLIRFSASNGELVPAPRGQGRGAYTCRRLSCFERAAASRAFPRTLRQKVKVDPALARLYTDTNG